MKKYKDLIIISLIGLILFFSYPLMLMNNIIYLNVTVYKIILYVIYPLYFFITSIYYSLENKKIKFNLLIIITIIFSLNLLIFYNMSSFIYLFVNVCFYILGLLISNLIIINKKENKSNKKKKSADA